MKLTETITGIMLHFRFFPEDLPIEATSVPFFKPEGEKPKLPPGTKICIGEQIDLTSLFALLFSAGYVLADASRETQTPKTKPKRIKNPILWSVKFIFVPEAEADAEHGGIELWERDLKRYLQGAYWQVILYENPIKGEDGLLLEDVSRLCFNMTCPDKNKTHCEGKVILTDEGEFEIKS